MNNQNDETVLLRPLIQYEMDFELTWKYAKEQLEYGNTLSQTLLRTINFEEGNFFILLPKEANLNNLYDFKATILPSNPIEERMVLGKIYKAEIINNLDKEIANYLLKTVVTENLTCAFEDAMRYFGEKLNELLMKDKIVRNLNKEVYYLIDKNNASIEKMRISIKNTNVFWHFLCVLSNKHYAEIPEMDLALMNELCENTRLVMFGAYDREAYFFWKPNEESSL
jgi:hypothetical protein